MPHESKVLHIEYHERMDYSQRYERISRPFRTARGERTLSMLDKALVYAFAAAFVILLITLAALGDGRLLRAFVVPAATFALVTVLRIAVNRPRPYEACEIAPLIKKDTRGKSMPSRHMASSVVIACTFLWISPAIGAVLLVGCACIAFTRIVGGVHYPSDIAAATTIALVCACIGFLL